MSSSLKSLSILILIMRTAIASLEGHVWPLVVSRVMFRRRLEHLPFANGYGFTYLEGIIFLEKIRLILPEESYKKVQR